MAGRTHAAEPLGDDEAAALLGPLASLSGLLLAVSGGPDSTALLVLAAQARSAFASFPRLTAVTVDHGLRPDSVAEAAAVADLCARLDVAHRTLVWTGPKPATGLQAAARAARHRLLADVAARAGTRDVATGHTRDDQAETVLMRLAAGSGPAGLAAMRPRETVAGLTLHRPLLSVPKARVVATLTARGVGWADDPSNTDPRFERGRLRAARAVLDAEGLTDERLARLAARLARLDDAVEAAVEEAERRLAHPAAAERLALAATELGALPDEVALRLLGRMIGKTGHEGPAALGGLERLADAVLAAARTGRPLRRTLAGAVVTVANDLVTVAPAPPRRS